MEPTNRTNSQPPSAPPAGRRARRLVPIYQVKLVRENSLDVADRPDAPTVNTPAEVAPLACEYLKDADREHFIVIMLSTSNRVIGINTAHVGSLSASIACAREVFKPAILANAARIIVAHNHPSGNLEPSRPDVRVSRRLAEAGEILEIPLLDSIIVGHDGEHVSLAGRGLLDGPAREAT